MLQNQVFYHKITKKIVTAFGSLFSDIKVVRKTDDESTVQTINVPIAYSGKEKWVVRVDQDPSQTNYVYTTLPRLAFEITTFSYDPTRKTNRNNFITCSTDANVSKTFAPVPYNIDIQLYVLTKTLEDGFQIVEQILPFFNPEFTMSLKIIPESNIIVDIPIILNSVDMNDEYDGDFQTRRFVTFTLSFTLKTQMFGPVSDSGIINKVLINTPDIDGTGVNIAGLEMNGDLNTGIITHIWNEDNT